MKSLIWPISPGKKQDGKPLSFPNGSESHEGLLTTAPSASQGRGHSDGKRGEGQGRGRNEEVGIHEELAGHRGSHLNKRPEVQDDPAGSGTDMGVEGGMAVTLRAESGSGGRVWARPPGPTVVWVHWTAVYLGYRHR